MNTSHYSISHFSISDYSPRNIFVRYRFLRITIDQLSEKKVLQMDQTSLCQTSFPNAESIYASAKKKLFFSKNNTSELDMAILVDWNIFHCISRGMAGSTSFKTHFFIYNLSMYTYIYVHTYMHTHTCTV